MERFAIAGPNARPVPFGPPTSAANINSALYVTPEGVLWSGTIGGLWQVIEGKRKAVPLPPGLRDPAHAAVLSIAGDGDGVLWVSFGRRGLFSWRDGAWQENGGIAGLAGLFPPVLSSDKQQRRLWLGSTNNRLAILEHGKLRQYGSADGLRIGTVLAILPTAGGAWLGGENGIAYFDGERAIPVSGRGDDPFAGTTGLVLSADGTLWINGGAGISAITPAEQQRAMPDAGYRVHFERLDFRDGLVGSASPITPFPSAIRSQDGALWFSTMGGTFTFDPSRLQRNTRVPPVYITALKANGRDYPVQDGVQLPAYTTELTVDFTALSFRAPERMGFRYQLEGMDRGWQELQGRRSVRYTNPPPGHYRFRVAASNDDGLWNEKGARLSFDIQPGLTQTIWFRVLCVGAGLLMMWLLHRWRLARLSTQLQLRMNERISERARIARALHDTILQSMQGLILHVHAARGALQEEHPVRERLDRVLDDADKAYVEGRDQVTALRVSLAGDIEGTIAETAESLQPDHPRTALTVQVSGERMRLREAVAEEVADIAREAIRNAFQHARATNIAVELDYGRTKLSLTVRDDGTGIAGQAKEGHWGLVGMQERATRIAAQLHVDGAAGPGTRINLAVPARHAYAERRRWRWCWRSV